MTASTDSSNTSVPRIAGLVPSLTGLVCALGLAHRLNLARLRHLRALATG